MNNGGLLLGFTIGAFLDYFVVPFIVLGFVVCYFIGMVIMPETPPYLFAKLRAEDGEQSLRFLRGVSQHDRSIEFEHELKQLGGQNSSMNDELIEREDGQKIVWADLGNISIKLIWSLVQLCPVFQSFLPPFAQYSLALCCL